MSYELNEKKKSNTWKENYGVRSTEFHFVLHSYPTLPIIETQFSSIIRMQGTPSLILPILQHITLHSKQSTVARLSPHTLRKDPTTLRQRLFHSEARHPSLRVVVGVSPRHRSQWPRRLLRRRRFIRHLFPTSHHLRRLLQPVFVVGHCFRRGGGGTRHV